MKHRQKGNIHKGLNGYWAVCQCNWVSTPQPKLRNARQELANHIHNEPWEKK